MAYIDELFDIRVVVGNKIEDLIQSNSYTKSSICSGAGISRPTLDKIINGEINNKVTFDKHISKILSFLEITPNELMGNIENPFVDLKKIRNILNISMEEISEKSGISIKDLKKVEVGNNIPLKKLRDIALCLGTNVSGLLGRNYFQTPLNTLYYFTDNQSQNVILPGGFWGHIGILMNGMEKLEWFPITSYTRKLVYANKENPFMVIPCLDNTLLVLNNMYLQKVVLLDEACDAHDEDWDCEVNCGEVPSVVFESLDDYYYYKEYVDFPDNESLSQKLFDYIDKLVMSGNLYVSDKRLDKLDIFFQNGKISSHNISFDSDDLDYAITSIYETGDMLSGKLISFRDFNEAEIMINMDNVSLLKLPLSKVEEMIYKNQMDE